MISSVRKLGQMTSANICYHKTNNVFVSRGNRTLEIRTTRRVDIQRTSGLAGLEEGGGVAERIANT